MFLGAMKQIPFYCHFKGKYKNVNEGRQFDARAKAWG